MIVFVFTFFVLHFRYECELAGISAAFISSDTIYFNVLIIGIIIYLSD